MIWVLVISAILRVFAMAGWAGPGQPLLLALATVTVAGLLLLAAMRTHTASQAHPAARVRTTLRERTLRTAFLAQRDPDAAGRPRPRAPGVETTAA